MTNSVTLRIKRPNKKQKERTYITDITSQYFRNLIMELKNSPYIGYNKKQVYNEPTEAYFFIKKQVSKLNKIKRYVWLRTKRVESDVNGKNHINKKLDTSTKQFIL